MDALLAVRDSGEPPTVLALLDRIGALHTHTLFTVEQSHDAGAARATERRRRRVPRSRCRLRWSVIPGPQRTVSLGDGACSRGPGRTASLPDAAAQATGEQTPDIAVLP